MQKTKVGDFDDSTFTIGDKVRVVDVKAGIDRNGVVVSNEIYNKKGYYNVIYFDSSKRDNLIKRNDGSELDVDWDFVGAPSCVLDLQIFERIFWIGLNYSVFDSGSVM